MKSVKEVSRETGVSVRTLHHYHAVGLLLPSEITEKGYRCYDEAAVERLRMIVIYRELGFPLTEIAKLLDAPDSVRNDALTERIRILEKRRQQLQTRIDFAQGLRMRGVNGLNTKGFEAGKLDEYSAQAQTLYGKTDAWKEYQRKAEGRTAEEHSAISDGMMALFTRLGELRGQPADSPAVQAWAAELQGYITEHYYTCTKPILSAMGGMYAGGGSMTENIDRAGGEGTALLASEALRIYCSTIE